MRSPLLGIFQNSETIYFKAVTRGKTVLPSAQYNINLYYIYFLRLFEESIIEINDDANKSFNTDISLKQAKNILKARD